MYFTFHHCKVSSISELYLWADLKYFIYIKYPVVPILRVWPLQRVTTKCEELRGDWWGEERRQRVLLICYSSTSAVSLSNIRSLTWNCLRSSKHECVFAGAANDSLTSDLVEQVLRCFFWSKSNTTNTLLQVKFLHSNSYLLKCTNILESKYT